MVNLWALYRPVRLRSKCGYVVGKHGHQKHILLSSIISLWWNDALRNCLEICLDYKYNFLYGTHDNGRICNNEYSSINYITTYKWYPSPTLLGPTLKGRKRKIYTLYCTICQVYPLTVPGSCTDLMPWHDNKRLLVFVTLTFNTVFVGMHAYTMLFLKQSSSRQLYCRWNNGL